MIDHISITVSDYEKSKAFYLSALEPLGISLIMEVPAAQTKGSPFCGFGAEGKPFFWIGAGAPTTKSGHVAFAADSRKMVDQFHAAALAAGAKDNGPPGLRPHYHPNYYGAFVLDPDGHNIEAVCHR
jgi:catechol 2,3-dioxygenase-like lactoylglutathione lyase family enzyme